MAVTADTIPDSIFTWPRDTWLGEEVPVFLPGDVARKCVYAARRASEEWDKALLAQEQGNSSPIKFDEKDFALAVFDKADQINDIYRECLGNRTGVDRSNKAWLKRCDNIITTAYKLAYAELCDWWPDDPMLKLFTLEAVRPFALAALKANWIYGADSHDDPPPLDDLDTDEYTKRYLPDPAAVRLRGVRGDPYNEYPNEPREMWVNGYFEIVEPPDSNRHSKELVDSDLSQKAFNELGETEGSELCEAHETYEDSELLEAREMNEDSELREIWSELSERYPDSELSQRGDRWLHDPLLLHMLRAVRDTRGPPVPGEPSGSLNNLVIGAPDSDSTGSTSMADSTDLTGSTG